MENRVESLFFALLRFCVVDLPLKTEDREPIDEETLKALYRLGRRHDLAHLVGYALEQNGLLPAEGAVAQALRKEYMTAVYRCTRMQHEHHVIADVLEREGISFMPLKGAVLREHYPHAWMRTSCDIDVLLHGEDIPRAEQALIAAGFSRKGEGTHDVSLYSQLGVHLELHFSLNDPVCKCYAALDDVWSTASLAEDSECRYRMSDEMFYLYHVAHMAKHFLGGGCGARPYLDLWILNHRMRGDRAQRNALLEQEGLLRFATVCEALSEAWLSETEHDEVTLQMQRYLLTGGVYGSVDNRVKVRQKGVGGRHRYLMSRIFMPYERLKYMYPVLQKHRWLTPFMQVHRWCARVLGGKMGRGIREARANRAVSQEEASRTECFIAEIGLSS